MLLHADIVGSTEHVRMHEATAHERITDAYRRLSSLVSQYGGVVHEIRGDALIAEFARASDAVAGAIAFQASNTAHIAGLNDDIKPKLRCGIALGEVIVADRTVTGSGIVLAQRLEQLAAPGGVCISAAIREALPTRFRFDCEALGEQELKGFDEPVHAFLVSVADKAAIPPPDPPESRPTTHLAARPGRMAFAILGVVVIATALSVWLRPWAPEHLPASPARIAFKLPDRPSLAVLPLTNMSDDKTQEYFADGMTEDLITDLSKVSGLFVIARNSTFTYKGRAVKIATVAEELGVRYVLEGSVRRSGDQVRINAQLIDAFDGGHVWAERYDGSSSDAFALTDKITAAIVRSLRVKLLPSETRQLHQKGTSNPKAHDAFLFGWAHHQSKTLEAFREARRAFEQAVSLDPDYSQAWAALVELHYHAAYRGFTTELGLKMEAIPEMIRRAQIRPSALGYDAMLHHLQRTERVEELIPWVEKLVQTEPNYPDGYGWRATVRAFKGDIDGAVEDARRAARLDPFDPAVLAVAGRVFLEASRYDEAIKIMARALERDPDNPNVLARLAAAQSLSGNKSDAEATAQRLIASRKQFGHPITLVSHMETWPFFSPSSVRLVREGLLSAGIPAQPRLADLGLTSDDLIVSEELRKIYSAPVRAVGRIPAGEWKVDHYPGGLRIAYWRGVKTGQSTRRIEGDEVVFKVSSPSDSERRCKEYRNRDGAKDTLDEYVAICGLQVFPFSRFDIPSDERVAR